MSRDRIDTAGSSSSFGLRERTNTSGSMDFTSGMEGTLRGSSSSYGISPQRTSSRLAPLPPSPQQQPLITATTISSSSSPPHAAASSSSSLSSSSLSHPRLRYWVDWIQRQPVPTFLLPTVQRFLGVRQNRIRSSGGDGNPNEPATSTMTMTTSTTTTTTMTSTSTTLDSPDAFYDDKEGRLFCVRGLDRVVFGTKAAADCILVLGFQPPRYLWYMISGAICDVGQLLAYVVLHATLFPDDTTSNNSSALCWMASFVLSIAARHTSHRYLVFGDYVPNYWHSLGRMYAGYSMSIVLSTVFNYVITQGVARVSHYVAYAATLLWTGLANYFILKRLWKMGGGGGGGGGGSGSTNNNSIEQP
ncbi:hypothetical protein ACA910_015896 [Epithemia clementina (nom. ined.)]